MSTLLKQYNQFSIACCIITVLWAYCQYEAIIAETLENYSGINSTRLGLITALQGVAFVLVTIPMGMIPQSKKNPNKLVLVGALLFCCAQFVTGPVHGISVASPPSKA